MQKVTHRARVNQYMQLHTFYKPEDIVAFDIETTGFAAETTELYLIGCAFYQDGKWMITQWFNDDGNSEREILMDFFSFIKGYKYIFNYNGDGFDIPYLEKKLSIRMLDLSFNKLESIDLYKQIRGFKDLLHLDNLKQKSIEKFLDINRLDKYSGGDLIKVYKDYLKSPSDMGKQLLLQHNYEDLEGLLYCSSLLSYVKLKAGCFKVSKMSVKDNRLAFSISLDYPIPKRIAFGTHDIIITGYQGDATISVPIISEELKFYFDNYKEYYYLPAEDMAVHKSVATYVDKNYRTSAKKETCYTRRNGHFITQIDSGILAGYKREYKDKETFIELVDSFLQDLDMLNAYARYIIGKTI
ncbi:MAG: ribonuclease H-like domain-containing protein [Lachnospiraceae bacterium]|nr:ribonuclease H-like domain-containing protein [Lachnospiraceae bacterium]